MAYVYNWTDETHFDVLDGGDMRIVNEDVSIYSLVEDLSSIFRGYEDEASFIEFLEETLPKECIAGYFDRSGNIVDLYSLGNDDVVVESYHGSIRKALRMPMDGMKSLYEECGITRLR